MTTDASDKVARLDRIRVIVNEDFERISASGDPFVVLNLPRDTDWEEASARYERYERFYRAENFQRLGDVDLTRKALDIRRAVGRAIVEVQGVLDSQNEASEVPSESNTGMLKLDPNSIALGDIYYRDGLTYLKLGDLENAQECFRTGCDYDPTRGILLAYLSYTTFRRRMNEPDVVEEQRRNLYQASRVDARNADIWVLVARMHLKLGEAEDAATAIEKVASLDPKHPKLEKLRKHATDSDNSIH
ncbi:MAG: hypothetical protein R3E66_11735 [bacterium]